MARPGNQHCANCSGTLGKLTHPLLYLFCLNILLTYTLQCIYLVAWRTCISLSVHDAAKWGAMTDHATKFCIVMDARPLYNLASSCAD